ncbi:MAG: TonB-dependent receptor [Candidatus Aminicenantes bacterium]|nr:TonB-dependent receptor [Candidatus Aminicenantes bacterium]
MKKLRIVFLLAISALLLAGTLSAQRSTGQIFGKVADDQGVPLPGVSITAQGPRLVGQATDITNALGGYRLLALPPGTYTIEYTLAGFTPLARKDVVVGAEMTVTLDITLTASTIEEQITVVGQSPLIDVKSTTRGAAMNRQVFTLLPKGRNFDSLLVTVPGVTYEPMLGGTSVDGASGAENMWYVDGISTSNLINGTSGQGVNFDFVEEVNFKSSGYNAEYGGSLGGVVSVLTRSGGNEFHGEVLGYYTGEDLTARRRDILEYNMFDGSRDQSAMYYSWEEYVGKQKWSNIEGGLNLGGYIIKDRLWFFASAIPNYNNFTRTLDYSIQGLTDPSRDINQKQLDWNAQVKISAQPFKNLRVSAGFINNMSTVRGSASGFPSSYTASTTVDYDAYDFDYPNMSASATADWIVSSNFMVSARGGFFRTDQNNQQPWPPTTSPYYGFRMEQPYQYASSNNLMFPEIPAELRHVPGWQNFPRANVLGVLKTVRQKINANLDLSYFASLGGEHAIKIGGQFIRQGENVDQGGQQPVVYLAWNQNLTMYGVDYARGYYGWYAVRGNTDSGPYGSVYNAFSNQWAFYAQDSWTIGQRLTINAGVRAESEYIPSYSQDPLYASVKAISFPFDKKISPRFGVIYDVFGDSSLKAYGSFAIYQDVMKLDVAANAFGGFKWKSAYYTLDDWDYTKIGVNGNYPGTLLEVLDFRAPSFGQVDPDIRPFTQREIAVGVDKKLTEDFSASLRVVNKSVLYAVDDMAIVIPGVGESYFYSWIGSPFMAKKYAEAKALGTMPEGVPNMPKAKREYWGVNLSLDKRLSNNWLMGISGTWSSLRGNYSGLANSDENGRNNPNGERSFDLWYFQQDYNMNPIDGPLATDRPLVFKAYGSYVFPMGLTVGAVMQAMSGTPLTTSWNFDGPGYYPYNRGDLGRTPMLYYADAYIEYNLRLAERYGLQFSVNLSNVFNVETPTYINTLVYRDNVSHDDAAILTKTWVPDPEAAKDGFFGKASTFFAPFQARLGVKFSF